MKCRNHNEEGCVECSRNPDAVWQIRAKGADTFAESVKEFDKSGIVEPPKPAPWDELVRFMRTIKMPAPPPARLEVGRWVWEVMSLYATMPALKDWSEPARGLYGIPVIVRPDFPWRFWSLRAPDGRQIEAGWVST